ncbi:MAG: hypothetical protein EOP13_06765 [Pseudomonas sp.]|uniref:aldolase/citrate lyase family protein n=1 Tax=Pseudomonas sp. TaxID=306 RepID=UPI0011FA328A|nr:aldolase/citrate lyase family protein [Pseudomonas sp.]RZI75012.1 MAG: hypothetical protein EOP13_06765 [Pseudomonas sp.]
MSLIETVRGLLDLRATAALRGVGRLAFGSIDFCLDAGMADDIGEPGMTMARATIVLASRHAGLARRLGFGGKLCIHPRQVGAVHRAFAPTAEERHWTMDVIHAFEAAGGSAVSLRGQMVDLPEVERARRLVAG